MAKGSRAHVKWDDGVSPRLGLLSGNINRAMERGVYEVAATSVQTMRRRVETAVTETGRLRASGGAPRFKPRPAWFMHRGPGRVESGALLNSARWVMKTGRSQVSARAGFINAPRYTALQELGTPGLRGVPAMGAYALGHTKVAATIQPTLTKYTAQAVRAAELNRVMKGVS